MSVPEIQCQLENQLSLDSGLVAYVKRVGHIIAVSSGYGLSPAASEERKTADECDNLGSDMCLGG